MRRHDMFTRVGLLACAGVLALAVGARAGLACPEPATVRQPDGTEITLRLRGDEHFSWHEDAADGRPILRADDGWWVYAEARDDRLVGTDLRVGLVDPALHGLVAPHIPSLARAARARSDRLHDEVPTYAATTGVIKNLVVLVAFADMPFTKSLGDFDALFNATNYVGDGAIGSVRDYYTEVSYGQLLVDSVVVGPVTVPQGFAYYGANSGTVKDVHVKEMVLDALAAVEASGFDFSTVDLDGDGWVDALDLIHAGYGEEVSGNDANFIWSKKAGLTAPVTYDGVKLQAYHTEPELRGGSGAGITRIGVICHETGHFLGLPDLYDTTYASKGIGDFCLMAGGIWNGAWAGADSGVLPSPPSAWCKRKLGWTNPVVVSAGSGTHSLEAQGHKSDILELRAVGQDKEYFLVEYRGLEDYDVALPGMVLTGGGLLIWHIDENQTNNTDPSHYMVDLEEASPTQHLELNMNDGDGDDYWRTGTQVNWNKLTTPWNRLYSGKTLGFDIFAIGSAYGSSMTLGVGGDGLSDIFVDFSATFEGFGLWQAPKMTLGAAVAGTSSGQHIGIKAGSTPATMALFEPRTYHAIGGTVRIGN